MIMDKQDIYNKISTVKRLRPLTNCYSMDVVEKAENLWERDGSFLFPYDDHGIKRLTYFVKDWVSLDSLLARIETGKYYLEFMTREPEEYTPQNAVLTARMMRLANADCRSVFQGADVLRYRDDTVGEIASVDDAREINVLLWSVFRTEVSHLLTDMELAQVIQKGQISIHRGDAGIDAVLQAEIMPKKFYINQIVNRTEKSVIHAMLLNRLCTYVQSGGKYLYAWVEEQNIASQKFHAKYGMVHDGMWNMVFCLEK